MALETKTQLTKETINKLQNLIQCNIDSRDGFKHAADSVEDLTLSTLFESLALQRGDQADQLASYVRLNSKTPPTEGSMMGALHRAWMSVREALSTNNLVTVLSEAERGEDQIKQAYETALKETAGSAVNDIITQQYAQVKAAHDRVRDLRDEYKSRA